MSDAPTSKRAARTFLRPRPGIQPPFAWVAITGALALSLVLLRLSGLLQPLELLAYDLLLAQVEPSTQNQERVTLIGIDEADLNRYGWPLDDATLARMLERLIELEALAIGVEIYRDAPVPPGSQTLSALLESDPRIHWIYHFTASGEGRGVRPPAVLRGTERAGFGDLLPDPGGIVRRGLLFLDDGEQVGYSIALRLAIQALARQGVAPQAAANGDLQLGAAIFPRLSADSAPYQRVDAGGYQFLLDYRDRHPPPRINLRQLLEANPDPALIRDRTILVGSLAVSSTTLFHAPMRQANVAESRLLHGVDLHAQITRQLLRQANGEAPVLRGVGPLLATLWSILWLMAGALLATRLAGLWPFLLAALLLLATLYGISLAALEAGWVLPIALPTLALLTAMTLLTAQRMSRLRREQRHLTELFGRYQSHSIMETLLKNPEALRLGGERREVTVMMTDLRGFSAIAERHSPEAVVEMLNHYFEFMIEIVHRHNGTIIEFLGDGLLVIFGAPIQDPRHRLNACRCALEMQGQCMAEINRQNHKAGRPQLEMGAGLHCGESVIGNLGSLKRAKYSVVGSVVNLTARIESYTSGGQILLSPQMTENCGDQLQLGKELEVYPKGFAEPLRLTELHGIKDEPQGWLKPAAIELRELQEPIPIRYQRLDGKHIQGDPLPAQLLAIGPLYARMAKTQALAPLEQIQFKLNEPDHLRHIDLYARVSACEDGANLIRLAPMPEEVRRYLQERA